MHVVKLGETLTKIAKNNEVSTADILKVNPSMTAGNLMPEQIIRIPNLHSSKEVNTSKAADYKKIPTVIDDMEAQRKRESNIIATSNRLHTVEQGQTMYAISLKCMVFQFPIFKMERFTRLHYQNRQPTNSLKRHRKRNSCQKRTPIEPKPTPNDIKQLQKSLFFQKRSITEKNELKTTVNSVKTGTIKQMNYNSDNLLFQKLKNRRHKL